MNNKCNYINDLENRINKQEKYWKILIYIVIFFVFSILIVNGLKNLFLDKDGNFSNEIFWSALGAIGSIIAFAGVIYTIYYTEKARIKQNEYEYKKQQLIEEQWRFNERVLKTLIEIDPVKFIEVISRADVNNFLNVGQELTIYMASLRKIEYQLYWYYDKNGATTPKLTEFLNEINSVITLVEECILEYSSQITPMYCDFVAKSNLLNIKTHRNLSEDEEITYALINSKYPQEDIFAEITKRTNGVSKKIIGYKNRKWNYFIELAKDVVNERKNIIDKTLESI